MLNFNLGFDVDKGVELSLTLKKKRENFTIGLFSLKLHKIYYFPIFLRMLDKIHILLLMEPPLLCMDINYQLSNRPVFWNIL